MKQKWKWWLMVIPVLLILMILGAVFRDAILIRVAPKAVLTSALNELFSQLEQRFQRDPLLMMAGTIDQDGKYTIDMKTETEKDLLGEVTYDMTVQTDGAAHRLYANGTASTSSKKLDLSVYLDADFMAVSSEDLVGGTYYGITYDTFASDIRKIPLLNFLVSDSLLSQWDSSVQDIQSQMSRTYALPSIPEASQRDVQKVLLGIAAMPCKVEKCSILLDNTAVTCHKLDFSVSGQQVGQFLSMITDGGETEYGAASVSFYLFQNSVIKISLLTETEGSALQYSLDLGQNPMDNLLTLQGTQSRDGQCEVLTVAVATQRGENRYTETWNIQKGSGNSERKVSVTFDWNPLSGDMTLTTSASPEPCSLNLTETENGFQLVTDDLLRLTRTLSQDGQSAKKDDKISCVMTVSKGSEIITPDYKNLDQWSMEDFLALLNGVGSLLGIRVQ